MTMFAFISAPVAASRDEAAAFHCIKTISHRSTPQHTAAIINSLCALRCALWLFTHMKTAEKFVRFRHFSHNLPDNRQEKATLIQ
jgi:hypothetical protein